MTEQKQQWQPIETAPRDGSRILVKNRDDGYDEQTGYRTYSNDIGVAEWSKSGCCDDYGWISSFCCDFVTRFEPTHWMPLPEPPKEEVKND